MKITKKTEKKDGGSRDKESNFGPPRHEGILGTTQGKRSEERNRERERERDRKEKKWSREKKIVKDYKNVVPNLNSNQYCCTDSYVNCSLMENTSLAVHTRTPSSRTLLSFNEKLHIT